MKTKIIPFDLETAKKIQAGEIEGKIKTRDLKETMKIVCYDSTAGYCSGIQPIITQDIDECENLRAYFEDGAFIKEGEHPKDLVLEVPDNKSQFKPFDKVLIRENNIWFAEIFSHYTTLGNCYCIGGSYAKEKVIPYEGNEYLVGTTDKPKED